MNPAQKHISKVAHEAAELAQMLVGKLMNGNFGIGQVVVPDPSGEGFALIVVANDMECVHALLELLEKLQKATEGDLGMVADHMNKTTH